MKQFEELTSEELVALTDDRKNYYCDLACASEGAPLLPTEPVEPVKPEVEATQSMAKMGIYYNFYTTPEHAAEILAVITKQTIYADDGLSPYRYLKPLIAGSYGYPSIESETFIERATYDAQVKELEAYKVAKNTYDDDIREYRRISEKRTEITGWIFEKINVASSDLYTRNTARENFKRYLTLAHDQKDIAMNFLLKAFPDLTFPEYSDLLNELYEGYVWNAPKEDTTS